MTGRDEAQARALFQERYRKTPSPLTRLLDVGSGRGWPGLYLAGRTGCRVVLTPTYSVDCGPSSPC